MRLFILLFIMVTLLVTPSYGNQYTDALAPPLVLTGGPRSEVRNGIDKNLIRAEGYIDTIYMYPLAIWTTVEHIEDLLQLHATSKWHLDWVAVRLKQTTVEQLQKHDELRLRLIQAEDQITARLDEIIEDRNQRSELRKSA